MIDVLGLEKRRRRTTQEKIAIVQQSFEPGMTVSLVARQHGVAASQASREGCSPSESSRRSSAAFCPGSSCAVSAEKTALSASVVASARVRSMTSTDGKITLLLRSQDAYSVHKSG